MKLPIHPHHKLHGAHGAHGAAHAASPHGAPAAPALGQFGGKIFRAPPQPNASAARPGKLPTRQATAAPAFKQSTREGESALDLLLGSPGGRATEAESGMDSGADGDGGSSRGGQGGGQGGGSGSDGGSQSNGGGSQHGGSNSEGRGNGQHDKRTGQASLRSGAAGDAVRSEVVEALRSALQAGGGRDGRSLAELLLVAGKADRQVGRPGPQALQAALMSIYMRAGTGDGELSTLAGVKRILTSIGEGGTRVGRGDSRERNQRALLPLQLLICGRERSAAQSRLSADRMTSVVRTLSTSGAPR